MNRPFALLLCLPLIWWLWKEDQRSRPPFSPALWIPLLWLLLLGSRSLSWWLGVGAPTSDNLEGNPFDRILYLGMIFLSLYVLSKRRFDWVTFVQQNKAIFFFYFFLLVTILWSEYPFVTFKRWFKEIGGIFVVLIILTEPNRLEAIKSVFTRCAYVWFPLSIVFIKYFPEIGRVYTRSGGTMYSGVAQQKNSLGEIVIVAGLAILSELFRANCPNSKRFFNRHRLTVLFVFGTGLWLLLASRSKTSLICFIVGATIVLSHKLPFFKGRPYRLVRILVTVLPLFLLGETLFNVSEFLLQLIGRDSTFTGRTEIWQAVRENPVNPITGCGYTMYWDLHKVIQIGRTEIYGWKSAHNGYIETYLDGGFLGLLFLAVMLIRLGIRATREFLTNSEYGRLAFAFYLAMLLCNVSESIYARRSALWFAFLLFGLELRGCLPSTGCRERNVAEDSQIDAREPVGVGRA